MRIGSEMCKGLPRLMTAYCERCRVLPALLILAQTAWRVDPNQRAAYRSPERRAVTPALDSSAEDTHRSWHNCRQEAQTGGSMGSIPGEQRDAKLGRSSRRSNGIRPRAVDGLRGRDTSPWTRRRAFVGYVRVRPRTSDGSHVPNERQDPVVRDGPITSQPGEAAGEA
jgi:hypothetical protein